MSGDNTSWVAGAIAAALSAIAVIATVQSRNSSAEPPEKKTNNAARSWYAGAMAVALTAVAVIATVELYNPSGTAAPAQAEANPPSPNGVAAAPKSVAPKRAAKKAGNSLTMADAQNGIVNLTAGNKASLSAAAVAQAPALNAASVAQAPVALNAAPVAQAPALSSATVAQPLPEAQAQQPENIPSQSVPGTPPAPIANQNIQVISPSAP